MQILEYIEASPFIGWGKFYNKKKKKKKKTGSLPKKREIQIYKKKKRRSLSKLLTLIPQRPHRHPKISHRPIKENCGSRGLFI